MLLRKISGYILEPTPGNVAKVSAGCLGCALAARALIDPILPVGVPYVTLWVAVDVAAVMAGWRAAALVIALGALAGWYVWLPPRFSFTLDPASLSVVVVFLLLAAVQAFVAALMREALIRLERADKERELLVRELVHRLKNQLTVFGSIASNTLRYSDGVDDARGKLLGRTTALARALDAVASTGGAGAELALLVRDVVLPLAPHPDRLEARGPPIRISPERAQSFSLALHELATNALKHGAWSTDRGLVAVSWTTDGDHLVLKWVEPKSEKASLERQGFGSKLIKVAVADAQVDVDVTGDERRVTFRMPLAG